MALKLLDNGVTIAACHEMEWYKNNQWHEFNGKRYFVILTKDEFCDRHVFTIQKSGID